MSESDLVKETTADGEVIILMKSFLGDLNQDTIGVVLDNKGQVTRYLTPFDPLTNPADEYYKHYTLSDGTTVIAMPARGESDVVPFSALVNANNEPDMLASIAGVQKLPQEVFDAARKEVLDQKRRARADKSSPGSPPH